ncbi:hypothetical protein ES705_07468 [subsurface metagenome]
MKVLGVHIGHDSSACLVIDGKIIADAAEERFTRIKHYSGLPINAIDYCLKISNISIDDIDFIAVPSKNPYPELNFLLDLKGENIERKSGPGRMLEFARRIMKSSIAKPPLYIKNFPIKDSTELIHVEHHLAHAASAYYTCGSQEKQLIITMDGAGDGVSIGTWRGEDGKITPLKKFPVSASLGWFYSNVTLLKHSAGGTVMEKARLWGWRLMEIILKSEVFWNPIIPNLIMEKLLSSMNGEFHISGMKEELISGILMKLMRLKL